MGLLGDKFNQVYQDPMAQIGLGLLSSNNGRQGSMGRGLAQGMQNANTVQQQMIQAVQQKQMQDQQMQQRAAQMQAAKSSRGRMDAMRASDPAYANYSDAMLNSAINANNSGTMNYGRFQGMTGQQQQAYKDFKQAGLSGEKRTAQVKNYEYMKALEGKFGSNSPQVKAFQEQMKQEKMLNLGGKFVGTRSGREFDIDYGSKVTEEARARHISSRQQDHYQVSDAADTAISEMDLIEANLNELARTASDDSTTGYASWMKNIPLTDASKWESLKQTVLANNVLSVMAELKTASASGSTGFGALSARELSLIEARRGSLAAAIGAKAIKENIDKMVKQIQRSRRVLKSAKERETTWYSKNRPSYDMADRLSPPEKSSPSTQDYNSMSLDELKAVKAGRGLQ